VETTEIDHEHVIELPELVVSVLPSRLAVVGRERAFLPRLLAARVSNGQGWT
jgi:hypothetical protein